MTEPSGVEQSSVSDSRLVRIVFGALGFLFLGLGIAGIFVPLLPVTINIILAAYFFFRSNDRMYQWLINHPRFGPALRDYRAGLGIPRKIKAYAIAAIVVTFTITMLVAVTDRTWRIVLLLTAVAISAYILSRPTKEKVLAARAKAGPVELTDTT